MLLIKIDNKSRIPVFKQIFDQIKLLIEKGTIKPGDRIPSSRLLAKTLGLNRTTVYRAYEELWSFGYIESRQGSYSIVRKRVKLAKETEPEENKQINWQDLANPNTIKILSQKSRFIDAQKNKILINFLSLSPDPKKMPVEPFRKCINKVLIENGSALLSYNNTFGYSPLREFISKRLGLHGIQSTSEEIMISNGTQDSLELILKYLIIAGKKIVVEAPTYSIAIPLFRFYGAEIIEVPVNKNGLKLNALERTLKNHKIAFVFTMANFQNPTGVTTSHTHREKLLELCEKHNTPIIEDGFEEEMKYFGKAVLPIKSMDKTGLVIYLGTFSKTLFPGLRLGWIVANKQLINQLVKLKQISAVSGNFLVQAAVHEYCQSGNYELHVKRLHRIYRKRMSVALKTAEKYLPKNNCTYSKPVGGYSFWISLKSNQKSESEIVEMLFQKGVAIAPGNLFYANSNSEIAFRLSIAQLTEEQIEEGIQIIGNVLRDIV